MRSVWSVLSLLRLLPNYLMLFDEQFAIRAVQIMESVTPVFGHIKAVRCSHIEQIQKMLIEPNAEIIIRSRKVSKH